MLISGEEYGNVDKLLKEIGLKFQTQLNDVQEAIESQNIAKGRYTSFHAKYHNLEEVLFSHFFGWVKAGLKNNYIITLLFVVTKIARIYFCLSFVI